MADFETDQELLARYQRVKDELEKQKKRIKRSQPETYVRDSRSRFGGSLTFILLQIESELQERGISTDDGDL